MAVRAVATSLSRICHKIQQVSITINKLCHTVSGSQLPIINLNFPAVNGAPILEKTPRDHKESADNSPLFDVTYQRQQPIKYSLPLELQKAFHGSCLPLDLLTGKNSGKEIYYLPTSSSSESRVILDISHSSNVSYHCPESSNLKCILELPKTRGLVTPLVDPDLLHSTEEGKQALKIHKIRRRKIRKKHRLKWRKKALFMIRLKGKAVTKKKEEKRAEKLKYYKAMAQEFDAEKHIMEKLHQARRGGYRAKLF